MEKFLGKWLVDLGSTTGLDEYGAAFGFTAERIQMSRSLSYTLEFAAEGDKYSGTVTFATGGIPPQTYTFTPGDTFDYHSPDGTTPKLTVTIDGNKFVESYKLGDKEWTTTREVQDSVLTCTTTYKGTSVIQKLNKQ